MTIASIRVATCAAALALSLSTAQAQEKPADKASAMSILTDLTMEVSPRMAGSPAEAKAREWATARLKALGFSNVTVEPFTVTSYVRGYESAVLTAPYAHKFAVTALGYSGTTPDGGISGDLVYFETLDALKAAPAGSLSDLCTRFR